MSLAHIMNLRCAWSHVILGAHQGQRVQDRLAEREYADVGEEHWHNQQNCEEMSPGELRCGARCNPIRVDIYSTRHLVHRRCIRGSGEDNSENIIASSFLRKYKNPLTHCRSSRYDADQVVWTGTSESSDFSKL